MSLQYYKYLLLQRIAQQIPILTVSTKCPGFSADGGHFSETGRLSAIERHGAVAMDRVDFVLRQDKASRT